MTRLRQHRPAYTLLELLAASAIALVLLGALYVAFDITISQTESGRGVIAETDLGRAVFNRMGQDLHMAVGPLQPKSGGGISESSGTSSSSSSSSSSGTGSTSNSSSSSSSTTGSGTSSSTGSSTSGDGTASNDTGTSGDAESTAAADIPLQAGVVGTNNQLCLYISKVPTWLSDRSQTEAVQVASDLRRIVYYIPEGGRGLYRQEHEWVTAEGVQNSSAPIGAPNPNDLIIPEAKAIQFEYADGEGYTSAWDGSGYTTPPAMLSSGRRGPSKSRSRWSCWTYAATRWRRKSNMCSPCDLGSASTKP